MVMVHSEDHTPANENRARCSGSPRYAAAVLPTIDQNKKNLREKMHYNCKVYETNNDVMTTAGSSL
jgi:hypothetical protein